MRRTVLAILSCFALLPVLLSNLPAMAAKPANPAAFTAVVAKPGPGVGEITLTWQQSGKNTTGYVLKTALTVFKKTTTGRSSSTTNIPGNRRSITLSAAEVSALHADVASGNALYYRFAAVNTKNSQTTTRWYPYLAIMMPRPEAPQANGTPLRVASFNVRTARATQDKRSWLQRAPDVAQQILSRDPGVVAIQELGPGRADGKTGTTNGTLRQTISLENALAQAGGGRYRLVRTTPYVAPGVDTATQGARILYDTSRYTLVTDCPETTGKKSYSPSCSITLPIRKADTENQRIRAAMAQFQDKTTGARFWFVSVHLDHRHSGNQATEATYDALRASQASAVVPAVEAVSPDQVPVIVGGDFNSWQNSAGGNTAHDRLIAAGFYDASAAVTRVNFTYTTFNGFKTTLPKSGQGLGVHLDQLFVRGARGASYWENVMEVSDTARPSDHNMVLSDLVI